MDEVKAKIRFPDFYSGFNYSEALDHWNVIFHLKADIGGPYYYYRSLIQTELGNFDEALSDANKCIEYAGKNYAYIDGFRCKANIYFERNEMLECLKVLALGLKLCRKQTSRANLRQVSLCFMIKNNH